MINQWIECKDYLVFVKGHSCLIGYHCLGPVTPHHLIAVKIGQVDRNDFTAVPLCVKHHGEIEQISLRVFETKYAISMWKSAVLLQTEFWTKDSVYHLRTGIKKRPITICWHQE